MPIPNQYFDLELMQLADACEADEFGNVTYVFRGDPVSFTLNRCAFDGDTMIIANIAGQEEPLINIALTGCPDGKVVSDKRGKYVEFVGQSSLEDSRRGTIRKMLGFRVFVAPIRRIEVFFNASTDG